MAKVPLQISSGEPPEPKIVERDFDTIEADIRAGFREWQDFSIVAEVREAIREAASLYCLRKFMDSEGATVANVKRAMTLLISRAATLEKTVELLTAQSNPHSTMISGYLSKHEFNDLEVLLAPLALFKLACERTIAEVSRYQRKGPDPDDALVALIWKLADIFSQSYQVPTTNWSENGKRNSPFMAFAWGVYISLPHGEGALGLAAFQERAHRVIKNWTEEQGK